MGESYKVKETIAMNSAVVIPTYNERENIEKLVEDILQLNLQCFIVIVDDNSPDGTGVLADVLTEKYLAVRVVHRVRKEGLGAAYIEGLRYVLELGVDTVITMDADFSHDPVDIPRLVSRSQEFDVVVGSRYVPGGEIVGWNIWRKLLSRGGGIASRMLLGLRVRDCTAGFKCYSRKFLESLDLAKISSQGYAFQVEMVFQAQKQGFSLVEIPIVFRERRAGESKVGALEILGFIQSVLGLCLRRFQGVTKNKPAVSEKVA